MEPTHSWPQEIRRWREAEGLSRAELARRCAVSAETIKAYELGRRRPTAETFTALLDALRVERGSRAAILESAGFAANAERLRPPPADYGFSIAEARREIDAYPWPASVNNELMEVVAANAGALALWAPGADDAARVGRPVVSNLMSLASDPAFGGRIRNWDQVIGIGVGIMKGHPRGAETDPESLSAYYARVMQEFLEGDPRFIARVLRLWETVEPRSPKSRWSTPVILDHPDAGELRFTLVSSMCNEIDGLFFNDWMPVDARTWNALDELKRVAVRKGVPVE